MFSIIISSVYSSELDDSLNLLQKQNELLKDLKEEIEYFDTGRVILLEKAVYEVTTSIKANGFVNMQTLFAYQNLVIKFNYSTDFFRTVTSVQNQNIIKQLLINAGSIARNIGMNDLNYPTIIFSTFKQVTTLLNELKKDENLPKNIQDLIAIINPQIGKLLSNASNGDRPMAFAAGNEIYDIVKNNLYDHFYALQESEVAFSTIIEIYGLMDYYNEFSQREFVNIQINN